MRRMRSMLPPRSAISAAASATAPGVERRAQHRDVDAVAAALVVLGCAGHRLDVHVEVGGRVPDGRARGGHDVVVAGHLDEHGEDEATAHDELLDVEDGDGVLAEGREQAAGHAGPVVAGQGDEQGAPLGVHVTHNASARRLAASA